MKAGQEPFYEEILRSSVRFSETLSGVTLRSYQQAVARAVAESAALKRGMTFVVIFPRQSGKNELQAQIETYLLTLFQYQPVEIVKVSPAWKPQSQNAMRRLERTLSHNLFTRHCWCKESGYIFRVGDARILFLSAQPSANVVGATASLLLECDEAQDVLVDKWDREIAPMAAATNATRIFWGTAWTSSTLLAREERAARAAELQDGLTRVFKLTADEVAKEVPAYGAYVAGEIARHGRNHPAVRTQYFSEEIDDLSGMFPAARLALLRGSHPALLAPGVPATAPFDCDWRKNQRQSPLWVPVEGGTDGLYAFLIDVGGQDEVSGGGMGKDRPACPSTRDSTTLTIVEIGLAALDDPLIHAPRYRVVHRRLWTGDGHSTIYAQVSALAETWQPTRIIVDATGAGEGLAGFLLRAFPERVRPFKFSQASKSDLGWRLIALVETGRLKDFSSQWSANSFQPIPENGTLAVDRYQLALQQQFFRQAAACELAALPGPGRLIRWGVPENRRDPATGELVHDDLLLSLALVGQLDDETWGTAESAVIPPVDPVEEVSFE